MSKIAFLFAGQGAQYIGMGRDIASEYPSSDTVFENASKALGFNIKDMILTGDEETLKITENTQPAILAVSIVCLQPLIEKGIKPDVVAGLSLGEYTAHVAAGTFSFEDAIRLVRKRGKYMQEAVPLGVGTMAAIIGLERQDVLDCCKKASGIGVVEAANFNCPGQIVVAGHIPAVEKVVELAREKGAKRSIILPVSAPFHCSLLKKAGENLAEEFKSVEISNISIPVISNVTADYIKCREEVKDILIKQVTSPVHWEDSINRMISDGVDTFIEIGPGKALSGFVRKINKDVKILNVGDLESLNKTVESLQSV